MQCKRLVVGLLMKSASELGVQLMRQLKQWELEIVVQLPVGEVVLVLHLRRLYDVGWSHGISVEFELGHFRRLSTVASQFGVETEVVDEEAAVAVEL